MSHDSGRLESEREFASNLSAVREWLYGIAQEPLTKEESALLDAVNAECGVKRENMDVPRVLEGLFDGVPPFKPH
jgi:hypothetical protein